MNSELSMDQALIEKLAKILEANLDKEHFGVKELAKEIELSRSQLNRKLQSIRENQPVNLFENLDLKKLWLCCKTMWQPLQRLPLPNIKC